MTMQEKVIKNKVGLLKLGKELGNVSRGCKIFGYSRNSFYRFEELCDRGDELALQELTRRKLLFGIRCNIDSLFPFTPDSQRILYHFAIY